jgi:hypothetical protein
VFFKILQGKLKKSEFPYNNLVSPGKPLRGHSQMSEGNDPNLIKAVSCEIPLGDAVLDAYMLPNGEKRIGLENTGVALGYTERWFYNRTKRESKSLKALQATGFTGAQTWVSVLRQEEDKTIRGASLAKTISLRDFVKLVTYEATAKRNLKAIILLAAFAETGLEHILEDAFAGRSIDFILEKIVHYSKWTYKDLEEVLQYNREEVRALYR